MKNLGYIVQVVISKEKNINLYPNFCIPVGKIYIYINIKIYIYKIYKIKYKIYKIIKNINLLSRYI